MDKYRAEVLWDFRLAHKKLGELDFELAVISPDAATDLHIGRIQCCNEKITQLEPRLRELRVPDSQIKRAEMLRASTKVKMLRDAGIRITNKGVVVKIVQRVKK
jgi:hypothetical protein